MSVTELTQGGFNCAGDVPIPPIGRIWIAFTRGEREKMVSECPRNQQGKDLFQHVFDLRLLVYKLALLLLKVSDLDLDATCPDLKQPDLSQDVGAKNDTYSEPRYYQEGDVGRGQSSARRNGSSHDRSRIRQNEKNDDDRSE
jgi:hypothetical protein